MTPELHAGPESKNSKDDNPPCISISDPTPQQKEEILARLDRVENAVNQIKTPLSFADQLFVLRSHVNMVRERLAHEIARR